jgi:hypothetical protein
MLNVTYKIVLRGYYSEIQREPGEEGMPRKNRVQTQKRRAVSRSARLFSA